MGKMIEDNVYKALNRTLPTTDRIETGTTVITDKLVLQF